MWEAEVLGILYCSRHRVSWQWGNDGEQDALAAGAPGVCVDQTSLGPETEASPAVRKSRWYH